MDPFTIGLTMIAAGSAMDIYGRNRDDKMQIRASRMNLDYFRYLEQANNERYARDQVVLRQQQQKFIGSQVGGFAKAGVAMEGSALDSLHETLLNQVSQETSMFKQFQVEQAKVQYRQISEKSKISYLDSGERKFMNVAGPLLSGASRASSMYAR